MFQISNLESISKILANPTWDILVVFFFIAAGFFYGISAGKKRLLSVLFALYISILLITNFSYLDLLFRGEKLMGIFLFRLLTLLVLIMVLAFIFNKTVFRGIGGKEYWWQVFILSFFEVGFLMSAIFQLLPTKELFTFSPVVKMLFASEQSFFCWTILPLVALFFIVKRRKTQE